MMLELFTLGQESDSRLRCSDGHAIVRCLKETEIRFGQKKKNWKGKKNKMESY